MDIGSTQLLTAAIAGDVAMEQGLVQVLQESMQHKKDPVQPAEPAIVAKMQEIAGGGRLTAAKLLSADVNGDISLGQEARDAVSQALRAQGGAGQARGA